MITHWASLRRLTLERHLAAEVGAAVLLMICGRAAVAQSPIVSAATSEGSDTTLQTVVVTAQKREERLQDVPISIAVLDGKVLDQQSNGGTLEALARVPAISQSMSDAGGMTQISMRGVAPAVAFGDGSTTVGYYVDGVPFALVRSAAIPNTNDYDMSRIEVLRGPQGTLYGATALNGVVHIITNDADPTQFEAKARVGGAGTDGGSGSYRGDAAVNIPIIADKFAVRVVAGYDHEGGWIDQPNLGRKDANTTDTTSLRVKVDIRPIDNLKIDLAGWYSDERDAAASFGINGAQADTYNPSPSTTDYDAFNARVVYDLPFASLSSSTSYMKLDQNVYTDYDNELPPAQQTHNRLDELYSNLPARVLTEEFLVNSRDPGPGGGRGAPSTAMPTTTGYRLCRRSWDPTTSPGATRLTHTPSSVKSPAASMTIISKSPEAYATFTTPMGRIPSRMRMSCCRTSIRTPPPRR